MLSRYSLAFSLIAFLALGVSGRAEAQPAAAQDAPIHYAVSGSFNVPGGTEWGDLALDPQNNRLYIGHGDNVDIVDLFTKKVVGSIPAAGARGIALAPAIGRGFISNGNNSTVTMFDIDSMSVIGAYGTGLSPDAIVYDPTTQMVFTANTGNNSMTAIMAKDGTVFGTLRLEGQPAAAVADGQGHLYVNLKDKAQISIIDTRSLSVSAHYELPAPCSAPSGLAIDILQGRLFAACGSKVMMAVDMASGGILAVLPIGAMSDTVAYDMKTQMAFSAGGDGMLSIVDASAQRGYRVAEVVRTSPGARTMALDSGTQKIYLVAAQPDGPAADTTPQRMKPGTFMVIMVDPTAP